MADRKREVNITRVLNAPRELVFRAWTDETQLAEWWGPRGFTNPVCNADPQPGGALLIHMKGPDGVVYPMDGTFVEVSEPERIVFKSRALENGIPLFEVLNTVTFTEEGGKTRMELNATVTGITDEGKKFLHYLDGMNEGWTQSIVKLEQLTSEPFVIQRVLNAAADRVWKAISDRDEMSKWYFDLADFKPEVGFEFRFPGGPAPDRQYTHICRVTEVIPGRKLTYSWRYDGYAGNSFVTFDLIPEGDNTRIRLTHVGLGTFPASVPDFARQNFAEGWTYIIGKSLPEYVEK